MARAASNSDSAWRTNNVCRSRSWSVTQFLERPLIRCWSFFASARLTWRKAIFFSWATRLSRARLGLLQIQLGLLDLYVGLQFPSCVGRGFPIRPAARPFLTDVPSSDQQPAETVAQHATDVDYSAGRLDASHADYGLLPGGGGGLSGLGAVLCRFRPRNVRGCIRPRRTPMSKIIAKNRRFIVTPLGTGETCESLWVSIVSCRPGGGMSSFFRFPFSGCNRPERLTQATEISLPCGELFTLAVQAGSGTGAFSCTEPAIMSWPARPCRWP